jgi:hypothetical protein
VKWISIHNKQIPNILLALAFLDLLAGCRLLLS